MLLEVALIPFILGIVYFCLRSTYGIVFMCLIKFHYLGLVYFIDDIINAKHNKVDLPSKLNKIAIVTGGARGIGAEVVKKLLQCDMNVIIACRSISAGEKLILEIRNFGIISGRAKVYKLDNSSFDSVREFAKQIKNDYNEIHLLINNAGIMVPPAYKETKDGFEQQWAINYLSHFLLSSLLMPLLKAGGRSHDSSRIVNVTSCLQDMGVINFDCINNYYKGTYFAILAYAQSKLAQTMFTIMLQQFCKDRSLNVETFAVHPGLVNTDIFDNTVLKQEKIRNIILMKTIDKGATPILYAALDKGIENKGGLYICNCKESSIPSQALDKNTQKQLFELSLKQVKLDDFFQYL